MFDPDLYYDLARQRSHELIAEADTFRLGTRLRRLRSAIAAGERARRHHGGQRRTGTGGAGATTAQ